MTLQTKAGSFVLNTGTGSQGVTGVGFQPQGVVFWAAKVTSETIAVDSSVSYGMADGTTQYCAGQSAEDGNAANTDRVQDDSSIIHLMEPVAGAVQVDVSYTSNDSDGFTINVITNTSSEAILVKYFAIGGVDNLVVGSVLASASPVTGLGFQPNLLLAMSSGQAAGDATSQHTIACPFGVANASSEWWVSDFGGENDRAQTSTQIRTAGFCGQRFNGAITWEASLTSFDAAGFTWSGSNTDVFWYMAIELPTGVESFVSTFSKSTATAPVTQALPDSTFTPQSYILATGANPNAVTDLANRDSVFSIGAYSEPGTASQFNVTKAIELAAGTQADMVSDDDEVLYEFGAGGTKDATATPQAITDSTPDVEWDPNTTNAIVIGYLALESVITYKIEGVTRNAAGSTLGNCRVVLLKRDSAAEASRIYTIVSHTNSDGSGNYSFTGLGDNDSLYMVYAFNDATPDVRGVTDDFLQPVIE